MEVQQIEECYKRNSQSGGMVATSKDQDKSGETLDDRSGANSENCEQEKGIVCGDDLAVDNRENKGRQSRRRRRMENGNNGGAHEDVAAEDEGDDIDYDYNGWHDYCRNDCVTDDDDNFVEGPGKGRSDGQSGGKGIRRPGGTGAAKSACGKKQRSRGGGYISKNNDSSVEITDLARDLRSPSRLDTEVTETEVGVDVVLVTPPQSKNKHTRVTEDNDDDAVVDTPIPQPAAFQGEEVLTKAGDNVSGTPTDVGCAPNQATEAVESGDICLETPPKQYNTHNRELEDEDDVDPPVTATIQGGGSKKYKPNKCSNCFKEGHKKTTCKEVKP
ncbi:hypothetical protein YC2023_081906 [Brassica napus]